MSRWNPLPRRRPLVNVIRLHGTIATGSRGQLSDAALAPAIERAFRKGKPTAVALSINSPGGSPVQSSLIAARIRRLADEKDIPVVAFVEDAAASGGYWLACAADEIFADRSSIVGSIGVIMQGFGFPALLERHGVERRVYTAGENKSQLDPFSPENPEDVARITALGGEIHAAFKAHVSHARGERLSDDPAVFSGQFWAGTRAAELGLIDGIAHLIPEMKGRYGSKTEFAVYGPRRRLFGRLAARFTGGVLDTLEERGLWARFGM